MKVLVFDTETTGLPKKFGTPAFKEPGNWPHLVSISWALLDTENMKIAATYSSYIIPENWDIPPDATRIHGITNEMAVTDGNTLKNAIDIFMSVPCDIIVAHNSEFDKNVVINAIIHDLKIPFEREEDVFKEPIRCSMKAGTNICQIMTTRGYKWPKLSELYFHIMKKPIPIEIEHQALYDTLNLVEIISKSPDLRIALGIETKNESKKNEYSSDNTTLKY
jgi:DNA polymerase III epsilon subunit-like protein